MEDSEFFKYHDRALWNQIGLVTQAKCAEALIVALAGSITDEFDKLVRTGQYEKAQEVEMEGIDRMLNDMRKVIKEAIPIAANFHKEIFGNKPTRTPIGDGDVDIPIE